MAKKEFSRLSAGPHKIIVHFIVATSLEEIICRPVEFIVDQIGGYVANRRCMSFKCEIFCTAEVHVTNMEDGAAIKLDSNFPAKFQYSLIKAEFKSCKAEFKSCT